MPTLERKPVYIRQQGDLLFSRVLDFVYEAIMLSTCPDMLAQQAGLGVGQHSTRALWAGTKLSCLRLLHEGSDLLSGAVPGYAASWLGGGAACIHAAGAAAAHTSWCHWRHSLGALPCCSLGIVSWRLQRCPFSHWSEQEKQEGQAHRSANGTMVYVEDRLVHWLGMMLFSSLAVPALLDCAETFLGIALTPVAGPGHLPQPWGPDPNICRGYRSSNPQARRISAPFGPPWPVHKDWVFQWVNHTAGYMQPLFSQSSGPGITSCLPHAKSVRLTAFGSWRTGSPWRFKRENWVPDTAWLRQAWFASWSQLCFNHWDLIQGSHDPWWIDHGSGSDQCPGEGVACICSAHIGSAPRSIHRRTAPPKHLFQYLCQHQGKLPTPLCSLMLLAWLQCQRAVWGCRWDKQQAQAAKPWSWWTVYVHACERWQGMWSPVRTALGSWSSLALNPSAQQGGGCQTCKPWLGDSPACSTQDAPHNHFVGIRWAPCSISCDLGATSIPIKKKELPWSCLLIIFQGLMAVTHGFLTDLLLVIICLLLISDRPLRGWLSGQVCNWFRQLHFNRHHCSVEGILDPWAWGRHLVQQPEFQAKLLWMAVYAVDGPWSKMKNISFVNQE